MAAPGAWQFDWADVTFCNWISRRFVGTTKMNLHYARLRLALRMMAVAKTPAQEAPQAANDNQMVWPFVPFPPGWHASGWSAGSDKNGVRKAQRRASGISSLGGVRLDIGRWNPQHTYVFGDSQRFDAASAILPQSQARRDRIRGRRLRLTQPGHRTEACVARLVEVWTLGHADAGRIPLSRPSPDSNQSLRTALQLFPVHQGHPRCPRSARARLPSCPCELERGRWIFVNEPKPMNSRQQGKRATSIRLRKSPRRRSPEALCSRSVGSALRG